MSVGQEAGQEAGQEVGQGVGEMCMCLVSGRWVRRWVIQYVSVRGV